jgi:hypothetical protein
VFERALEVLRLGGGERIDATGARPGGEVRSQPISRRKRRQTVRIMSLKISDMTVRVIGVGASSRPR